MQNKFRVITAEFNTSTVLLPQKTEGDAAIFQVELADLALTRSTRTKQLMQGICV